MRAVVGDITRLAGVAVVRCVATGAPADPLTDAILVAGGPGLQVEIERHAPLVEARPIVTPPHALPARAVIHVAAPPWRGGGQDEDRRLALAIERCLVTAVRARLDRVAFSPIGPGFPLDRAAAILVSTIHSALFAAPSITEVTFVCPTRRAWRVHADAIAGVID